MMRPLQPKERVTRTITKHYGDHVIENIETVGMFDAVTAEDISY